jgi:hypothetical protein
MYISEMLIRESHAERQRRAREDALARQVAELRQLRQIRQRAERQLRRVSLRAQSLGAVISSAD